MRRDTMGSGCEKSDDWMEDRTTHRVITWFGTWQLAGILYFSSNWLSSYVCLQATILDRLFGPSVTISIWGLNGNLHAEPWLCSGKPFSPQSEGACAASWSPNSTCLHLDFYLLSWWWQPLWSGGLLYRWLLPQQKAYWIRFFFKISFLCIFCPWHSKKQGKKQIKTLKKLFFLSTSWFGPGPIQVELDLAGPIQVELDLAGPIQVELDLDLSRIFWFCPCLCKRSYLAPGGVV